MEQERPDQLSDLNLKLEDESRQHLSKAAKWGKFISIVIFCSCALLLLIGIAAGSTIMRTFDRLSPMGMSDSISGGVILAGIIIGVALAVVIYYFMLNFSIKIKEALLTENAEQASRAFASLKMHFILMAIFSGLSLLISISSLF